MEKKRLLSVSAIIPGGWSALGEGLKPLLHRIIKNLNWLMPFSEGKIHYIGNDETEGQKLKRRMENVVPFIKHLRHIRRPHLEYAGHPFDKGLYLLPDYGNQLTVFSTEVRSAEVIAKRLLKYQ